MTKKAPCANRALFSFTGAAPGHGLALSRSEAITPKCGMWLPLSLKRNPPGTAGPPCRGNYSGVSLKGKDAAEGQGEIAVLAVDLVEHAGDGLLALSLRQQFKLPRCLREI